MPPPQGGAAKHNATLSIMGFNFICYNNSFLSIVSICAATERCRQTHCNSSNFHQKKPMPTPPWLVITRTATAQLAVGFFRDVKWRLP